MTVSFSCRLALALFIPCSAAAAVQNPDTVWAQPQQAALAEEILGCDGEQCWDPVFVAEALGPSRMSEDVRIALMKLLERFLDEQDVASVQGIPLEQVVKGEFFLMIANLVATLNDPRSILALARVGEYGYARYVARTLASFGEPALPALLEIVNTPGVSNFALSNSLRALPMMVEEFGANGLSDSARHELVRVARDVLHSYQGSPLVMGKAIDLVVALNEPDLVQMVRIISQNTDVLTDRGVDTVSANMIRQHAIDALAEVSGEP